jgi:hypothetical protein
MFVSFDASNGRRRRPILGGRGQVFAFVQIDGERHGRAILLASLSPGAKPEAD